MQNRVSRFFMILCLILLLFGTACIKNKEEGQTDQPLSSPSPDTILQTDKNPPVLHSEDWETPQPLPAPIDAEGDELSPFITLAGDELYYFYTPDLSVSEAKQALDGISGTYYSKKVDGVWSEPQKLLLSTGDTLDGCIYTDGQTLWFCSRRDGNYEDVDFYTAVWVDGAWGEPQEIISNDVSEVSIDKAGNLYFAHFFFDEEGKILGSKIYVAQKK